ncbi:MAG: xdhA [Herminiimonas sp.]|nr:xdhA [Herminiimonas sp.]
MADPIRFFHRGTVQSVIPSSPTRTLLQYLREDAHCTGTKEGCAEGDCGACTVVVGELHGERVKLKTVNACLQLLPTLDGKAVFTVEDLRQKDQSLHPVQRAMVECHGSQCGFCTPGFVMSLWSLYNEKLEQAGAPVGSAALAGSGATARSAAPGAAAAVPDSTAALCAPLSTMQAATRKEIDVALSGNLCRCTGYRPIIEAAMRMTQYPVVRPNLAGLADTLGGLRDLRQAASFETSNHSQRFWAPRTLQELVALRTGHPDAVLLAGGTDVGLWVTKQLRLPGKVIYLGEVAELRTLRAGTDTLTIGATVTLEDAYGALCHHYSLELGEMWHRFASLPIRNAGTLGGNVANGSPIGDSMPWLIALGAQVVLRSSRGQRTLALEDFYQGYQKKDLAADEIVEAVRVPLPRAERRFRTYKLARRFDQDISAVCAAFCLTLDGDVVTEARIAYGGMAAIPKRASHAEAALNGKPWSRANLDAAMAELTKDFAPLSDMRASSRYRMQIAQNLMRRFWLENRSDAPQPASALSVFAASAAS